jgi:Condensation domain
MNDLSDCIMKERNSGRIRSAPLTCVQQSYFDIANIYGADRNRRSVVSALRIQGALDIPALKRALVEVTARHEILRARIITGPDRVRQEIPAYQGSYEPLIADLSGWPPAKGWSAANPDLTADLELTADLRQETHRRIRQFLEQPCDLTRGPLYASMLVKVDDSDHVLVVALHHVIADGMSMGIALRDIVVMYLKRSSALQLQLPVSPGQFADHALWEEQSNSRWLDDHGPYWRALLADAPRIRITSGSGPAAGARLRAARIPIAFGPKLTAGLSELARRTNTTLVMVVLAAYIALIAKWVGTSDVTLGFVSSGRTRQQFVESIGCFAFTLYLRVQVLQSDSYLELLRRVTRAYRLSSEHQDAGRLSLLGNSWPCRQNTTFNWTVGAPGLARSSARQSVASTTTRTPLTLTSFPLEQSTADLAWDDRIASLLEEPSVMLTRSVDGVVGVLGYREDTATYSTMSAFVGNFRLVAETLLAKLDGNVAAPIPGFEAQQLGNSGTPAATPDRSSIP